MTHCNEHSILTESVAREQCFFGIDKWDLSSAGRASALQAEGHRFEPCRSHILIKYGGIAQLARAHGSYPWCRWFKSSSRYLYGILAQLGEHLPYKQRVIGSSPIGPIQYGEIAQLARAHGSYPWCRGFESPSRYFLLLILHRRSHSKTPVLFYKKIGGPYRKFALGTDENLLYDITCQ